MAVLSKDEARKHRAGKHADWAHAEACECGRRVRGNGGKVAHYRTCRAYLAKYGWPFSESDDAHARRLAFDEHPGDSRKALDMYWQIRIDEARRRGLLDSEETQ